MMAAMWASTICDVLVNAVPTIIVACGVTLVVVTREIDISVGSAFGVLATVLGLLTSPARMGLPLWEGILAVLLVGAAIGALNGALVVWGKVPSIIVTLGMLTVLQGVDALLLHGEQITQLPSALRELGVGRIAGIPIVLYLTAAIVLCVAILASRTALGRRLYAVGSHPDAARLAGISATRLKLFAFIVTGVLVAVAMLASVSQIAVVEPNLGRGFELVVVTAVLVGGTSIQGGRGSVVGAALAAIALEGVRTTLILLRLGESATYWERAIQGAFILIAVLVDLTVRSRRATMRRA